MAAVYSQPDFGGYHHDRFCLPSGIFCPIPIITENILPKPRSGHTFLPGGFNDLDPNLNSNLHGNGLIRSGETTRRH